MTSKTIYLNLFKLILFSILIGVSSLYMNEINSISKLLFFIVFMINGILGYVVCSIIADLYLNPTNFTYFKLIFKLKTFYSPNQKNLIEYLESHFSKLKYERREDNGYSSKKEDFSFIDDLTNQTNTLVLEINDSYYFEHEFYIKDQNNQVLVEKVKMSDPHSGLSFFMRNRLNEILNLKVKKVNNTDGLSNFLKLNDHRRKIKIIKEEL